MKSLGWFQKNVSKVSHDFRILFKRIILSREMHLELKNASKLLSAHVYSLEKTAPKVHTLRSISPMVGLADTYVLFSLGYDSYDAFEPPNHGK